MWSFVSTRFERHIPFLMTFREFKKILWNFVVFWYNFIPVSENAYGIEYITINLAIIYKCILDCFQSRKHFEAITDDLLFFSSTKKSHIARLEDLLKVVLKNGLKISPKKCQLFRKELQYMSNTIFIKDKRVYINPLQSRLEAIQKLKSPVIVKGCRSFTRMVHFLSIFCPDLQK